MKNALNSSEIFGDELKITVRNETHHGKVWLHSHTFYELVYVDKGFSLHSYNGKTTILTAGDLFAVCPENVHSYSSAYQATIYNCLFELDELTGLGEEILSLPGIKWINAANGELPLIKVPLNDRRDIVLLLEKMRWERANKTQGWELSMKANLIQFLISVSRLTSNLSVEDSSRNANYLGYIYKALQFIEENYVNCGITTLDIAEYTGLSVDYIAKQFKSQLTMSPTEYMRKFRVAKSMELLKTTEFTIAEIAKKTGFNDISLFSRTFKQIIGQSPVEFRNSK